jgi:hypothetical protein
VAQRALLRGFEEEFQRTKNLAERAIAQLDDAELHTQLNERQNSIASIFQHVAGNAMSRWTNFLTSDGEKSTRNRESEFVDRRLSRTDLLSIWDRGWKCLFDALASLTDADLLRTVTIRREPHTVCKAITRQMAHYGWHVGQIALIAKHIKGKSWQYLTIPPGQTLDFNRKMGM